ncbi:hypothetical protein ACO0LF_22985 [Undibacterium sp. Di27W]|uniref:hypothetical protein n=1 Tax=Undibacterium sp. Di27W TaxID=3413036 RepID=UPI003BEFE713
MITIDQLRIQVEQACNDEADFDELMQALDDCILAHPQEPEYLRLRIQMFEAAYDRISAWKDRCALHVLLPDDVDNHLALLMLQRRSALWIANDVFEEKLETFYPEDEEQELDADQEAALALVQAEIEAHAETLENSALTALMQLMASHVSNADLAHQILATWEAAHIWNPWQKMTMILQVQAKHPQDLRFKKAYASFLLALSNDVHEQTDKAPSGYFDHVIEGRFHAVTVYQAIAAIDALLAEGALDEEADLLSGHADLLKALDDYPAAAKSLRLAAQACQIALDRAAEDEREDLQTNIDTLLSQARICEAGKAAVQAAHFSDIDTSIAQMSGSSVLGHSDMTASPELAENLRTFKSTVVDWQAASTHDLQEPDAAQQQELQASANRVANSVMSLVRWDQIQLQLMQENDFQENITPWFETVAAEMQQTDMQFLSWFQNLGNVAMLGCEAPGQCWLSPARDFALTVEATSRGTLKRCLSRFSDGSLMLTTDSRSSNYFISGSQVHIFPVYKATSLTEMLNLHKARVDAHLANSPDIAVISLDNIASMQELENILRIHGREFRLSQGITDVEIRGLNVRFHQYFATQLKQVVAQRIAALK